ncbi:hypothetical protein QYF36_021947 [Acer negundo]|nr:hypothetical protein QYF36_021947 [Acer negundo]
MIYEAASPRTQTDDKRRPSLNLQVLDAEHGKIVLKLEDISGNGKSWLDADVVSFNTGHWWSHKGSLQGWDYMESKGSYHKPTPMQQLCLISL